VKITTPNILSLLPNWRLTSYRVSQKANSRPVTPHLRSARRGGAVRVGVGMPEEEQSSVGQYLDRAAMVRALAGKTQNPELRERLLGLAACFERLADEVGKWQNVRLARAAD
jgi:hypothetical protein